MKIEPFLSSSKQYGQAGDPLVTISASRGQYSQAYPLFKILLTNDFSNQHKFGGSSGEKTQHNSLFMPNDSHHRNHARNSTYAFALISSPLDNRALSPAKSSDLYDKMQQWEQKLDSIQQYERDLASLNNSTGNFNDNPGQTIPGNIDRNLDRNSDRENYQFESYSIHESANNSKSLSNSSSNEEIFPLDKEQKKKEIQKKIQEELSALKQLLGEIRNLLLAFSEGKQNNSILANKADLNGNQFLRQFLGASFQQGDSMLNFSQEILAKLSGFIEKFMQQENGQKSVKEQIQTLRNLHTDLKKALAVKSQDFAAISKNNAGAVQQTSEFTKSSQATDRTMEAKKNPHLQTARKISESKINPQDMLKTASANIMDKISEVVNSSEKANHKVNKNNRVNANTTTKENLSIQNKSSEDFTNLSSKVTETDTTLKQNRAQTDRSQEHYLRNIITSSDRSKSVDAPQRALTSSSMNLTPAETRQVIDQLIAQAKLVRSNNEKFSFSASLRPDWLGKVNFQLDYDKGNMIGKFTVESEITRELLQQQLAELKRELQGMGIQVEQFEISLKNDFSHAHDNHAGNTENENYNEENIFSGISDDTTKENTISENIADNNKDHYKFDQIV